MNERFRFGRFELETDPLELRREGSHRHLQTQPLQVLSYLVKNAARVVSREELRQVIWGDETFVDFERGLNFCISRIRSALGDDAAQPTYIRTHPRQGYQFIAPVELLAATAPPAADAPPARPRGHRRTILAIAASTGLVSALAIGALVHRHDVLKPRLVVAVARFDNETGDPTVDRLADILTDDLVAGLTSFSADRYAVIGNARILRTPREKRDLTAIGATLRADFVVLGQVQPNGTDTRILAHLIRLPEQTHVSVDRFDIVVSTMPRASATLADKIAADFALKVAR